MKYLLSAFVSLAVPVCGGDWPQFRGSGGNGVASDGAAAPANWSESKNLLWKTALPGRGSSSPIVWGERVFVTCYSGYGETAEAGSLDNLKRHLLCLERKTGKVLHQERLPGFTGGTRGGKAVYASTLLAGGRLYAVSRRLGTFVLEATADMTVVAQNTIAGDDSDFNATPAICGGRIFLRSNRYLYCIGNGN